MEIVENSFFDSETRYEQLLQAKQRAQVILDHSSDVNSESALNSKTGTVGCVCMLDGNIAAATSTGGMTNKLPGRIGDSPIIGAGTYADNTTCAVSCTGVGEEFMRHVAAYDISARMRYGKVSLAEAAKGTVFEKLPDNTGGIIAVDKAGNYSFEFNSPGMFRGMCASDGSGVVGIWKEDIHFDL
jgi:beta-aspartyl-peptidase (threonine type)